jgi:hypothetical protein
VWERTGQQPFIPWHGGQKRSAGKMGSDGYLLGSGRRKEKAPWASTRPTIGLKAKHNWVDMVKREKKELGCHKGLGRMQNRSTGKNRNRFSNFWLLFGWIQKKIWFWIFGCCLDEFKRNLDIAQGFGSMKFELTVYNILTSNLEIDSKDQIKQYWNSMKGIWIPTRKEKEFWHPFRHRNWTWLKKIIMYAIQS